MRLGRKGSILLIFGLFLTIASGLIGPFTSQASANLLEGYTFAFNQASGGEIKKHIERTNGHKHECNEYPSKCGEADIEQNASVYIKSGVYGTTPVPLDYINHPGNKYTWRGNYTCSAGTVTIELDLDIDEKFQTYKTLRTNFNVMELKHNNGKVDKLVKFPGKNEGDEKANAKKISSFPRSCFPQFPTWQNSVNKTFQMPIFNNMAEDDKRAWQGAGIAEFAGTKKEKDEEKQLDCDTRFNNPLTWIICPVVDVLAGFVEVIDNMITAQLSIESDDIFCEKGKTCQAYYTAWKSFRNIALGLMVIAGLVIVISQALGFEILDAYTIRKSLPRILIAAIGITLSWPILEFMIKLTNDLGFGIRYLIYAPFSKLGSDINLSFGDGIFEAVFGSIFTAGAAVAAVPLWVEFGGLGVMITYAFTAALAVLVAIVILILRQIVIIMLLLLAPLAIITYVFPNTQRIYRFWWDAFIRALLMFPLIAGMIAAGRVFSAIAISNGSGINQLIGFVAYFAPYFLIPATFRFSGSALTGLSNAIRGRAAGGFEGLRNVRKQERQKRHMGARKGGYYRDNFGGFTNPFTGKKHYVSNLANKITDNTIDAQDTWRVQAARRGGRLGRTLFGHAARDLENKIARQRIEHTANGAKMLRGRYHAARAVGGAFGYYMGGLQGKKMKDGTDAQQALVNAFGIGKRNKDGTLDMAEWRKAGGKFRGTDNETEDYMAASILERGNSGAREAAAELRASAITLDTLGRGGKEDTQRFDRHLWSMMVRADAGRLEQSEIDDWHNAKAAKSGSGAMEGYLETKQIQQMAAGKRTSQAEGYGGEYVFDEDTGRMMLQNAYLDPTSDEATKSFMRTSTQDIFGGKSEDFVDPEGHLSGWGQTILNNTSYNEMEKVDLRDADGNLVIDPRTGQPKTTLIDTGRPKTGQALLDAEAARERIQSGHGYSYGDSGVGGQIARIMQMGDIDRKWGSVPLGGDPVLQRRAGFKPKDNVSAGGVILPAGVTTHDIAPPDIRQPPRRPPPGAEEEG